MNLQYSTATLQSFLRTTPRLLNPRSSRSLYNHQLKARIVSQGPAVGYKHPADINFDLWKPESYKCIENLTLEDALQNHLKPGWALLPTDEPATGSRPQQYVLEKLPQGKLRLEDAPKVTQHVRSQGDVHIGVNEPGNVLRSMLSNAQRSLELDRNVQIVIYTNGPPENKYHHLHLRPDVIMKSFPTDTKILTPPQIWGPGIVFVIGKARTERNLIKYYGSTPNEEAPEETETYHPWGAMKIVETSEDLAKRRSETFDRMFRIDRVAEGIVRKQASKTATIEELESSFTQTREVIINRHRFLARLAQFDETYAQLVDESTDILDGQVRLVKALARAKYLRPDITPDRAREFEQWEKTSKGE